MEATSTSSSSSSPPTRPLHSCSPLRRTPFNRLFAAVYATALVFFFYHHISSFSASPYKLISSLLLLADIILALEWLFAQSFRMRPVRRSQFPENLPPASTPPAVDIFICTADPYKEPPVGVVNTALSVLAYDYPPEKLSVYVSDDGGSQLTLFAFMEAARFATRWIPFCRENNIQARLPESYFSGGYTPNADAGADEIKVLYEDMKTRVEDVIENGRVEDEHILFTEDRAMFNKWAPDFTQKHHQTIIQVLLDNSIHRDKDGYRMPNLIYVSREKSRHHHHNFKAGALNTLIRVSGSMTNAAIILNLDCDMFSNDPRTIWRALCYFEDSTIQCRLGYVQFPQIFHRLNKNDIYASGNKRLYIINPMGIDSFRGPHYVGSNCFFQRRAFFGGPSISISSPLDPHSLKISPFQIIDRPLQSDDTLDLAHRVASADYEHGTLWGSKMGIRYGSLVEDYFTGYIMQSEGWKGIFCNPERPAFLGDAPIALVDILGQCKRWCIGLLQVLFSKFCTLTFGVRYLGLFTGLGYSYNAFWPIWSVPLTIYAFVPQLALLNGISILPKVNDPWAYLYMFLFVGAYAQDLVEFILDNPSFRRWWNAQRMWMILGVSSYLFSSVEYSLSRLGISLSSFVVTTKIYDHDLSKRYDEGIYDFGVASPMFVPLTMAAIVNIVALGAGIVWTIIGDNHQNLALQMLFCGFLVLNSWPIYQAMILRMDKGRLPNKIIVVSMIHVLGLSVVASFFFMVTCSD